MTRLTPKKETLRALFAKSGNKCAFPGCKHLIINHKNQLIGEVCHIEAAEEGGERYNQNQSDEDRRHYDNLILLCHEHHVETNDVQEYTVSKLKEMKRLHEEKYNKESFNIKEETLKSIMLQINEYWQNIDLLNKYKHKAPEEFRMSVDVSKDYLELTNSIIENVTTLSQMLSELGEFTDNLWVNLTDYLKQHNINLSPIENIPYYENPFDHPYWEMLHMGGLNVPRQTILLIKQLALKHLELCLVNNPNDEVTQKNLNELREEFKHIATEYGYTD